MNKTIIFFLPFIMCATMVAAQTPPKFETWAANPVLHEIPAEDLKEHAVIVLQDIKYEFRYDGDYMMLFKTVHEIIRVQDEKGVEMFNKVEVPASRHTQLESIKARTILKSGKVVELSDDNIRRLPDENGGTALLFAMEGVEVNSEIEYLATEMSSPSYYGSVPLQYPFPVLNTFFELIYPKEFSFTEKGMIGFPTVKETAFGNRKHIKIYQDNMPALREEPYSFYNLYRMRAEYKLENIKSFHAGGDGYDGKNAWSEETTDFTNEYCKFTDAEQSSINKYLLTIGINGTEGEMYKLKKIENAIKSGVVLYPDNEDVNDKIDSIILKRTASGDGYVRFFAGCFKMAGVNFELGLTSDKHSNRLYTSFQNLSVLGYYVFYFPDFQQFMVPTEVYLRYPMMPASLVGNKATFNKVNAIGEAYAGVTDIREITSLPAAENMISVTSHVSFSDDMVPLSHDTYSYTGYTASKYRTALFLMPKNRDKQKSFVESAITLANKPTDIVNYSFYGEGLDNYFTNKPLQFNATVKLPLLVTRYDSNTYMVRAGILTGKQPGLFSTEDRMMPVDLDYPMIETHSITIIIPDNYRVENLAGLKTKTEFNDSKTGRVTMGFSSNYSLVGNKLTINTTERYMITHYSSMDYDNFKSVINACADFNKVAVVFTKAKPEKKHGKAHKGKGSKKKK